MKKIIFITLDPINKVNAPSQMHRSIVYAIKDYVERHPESISAKALPVAIASPAVQEKLEDDNKNDADNSYGGPSTRI